MISLSVQRIAITAHIAAIYRKLPLPGNTIYPASAPMNDANIYRNGTAAVSDIPKGA